MANKITMEMELRFNDNVTDEAKAASKSFDNIEKAAKEAGQQVDNLSKKKAKPTVDADVSRVDRKLNKIDSSLKRLNGRKSRAIIDGEDKATSKINKVLNKAKSWARKKYSAFLEAKDNATAKLTRLLDKAKGWTRRKYEAIIGLKDSKALNTLSNMSSKLRNLTSKPWSAAVRIKDTFTAPLTSLKNMLFSIQTLIAGIATAWAAVKFVKEPITLADSYSSAQIGFSTLLGESQGQQMMDDLDAFAKATPFKASEVIAQTQRMIAMGWEAENIIDDMTTIGDAAAATGKGEQGLQQIVTALAQIKTKGKLSTEELNQLAEAGISAKKYIAEGLGYGSGDKGIAKMTEDLEDGAISSGKALEALLLGMQEYKGMMDKTANETVSGLWGQIEDTFEINIARRWGQGLQDGAKKSFGSIVDLIETADGALTEFGDTVYEVGKKFSNWVADKLENSVERITTITDSYEFKEATLKEKVSMLWNGVIVDPLREWWEGGGQEKTAETAGEIGEWMGKAITDGLLALFGVTDILDEETANKLGESGGMSIAQSFAKGFKENFDGSAITDAFVDAISDVWNALPWWAKLLIGGYGIGKAAGGIANFAGGVSSFVGGVSNVMGGFSIASSAFPILTSSGSGLLGAVGKTGVALGASTTGGALLAGTAGIAGGVAAGASVLKGGYDIYNSYKARKAGDETEAEALAASGNAALNGVAGGAMAGAAIGSIIPVVGTALGALIGAGVGGVAGWILGDKAADKIRAAKYESEELQEKLKDSEASAEEIAEAFEKAKWENANEHFGDIKLSLREIESLASSIVWGDDLGYYESFTSAVQTAESSLQSLKTATEQANRWMWKAKLGVKFDADEIESIKQSFDDYISSAKSYVENKHYEFTAAVSLLVDVESKEGKAIIDSGDAFYTSLQEQLDTLGDELSTTLDTVLEDGVISTKDKVKIKIDGVEYELNEQDAISKLQQKIAEITEKVANAEQQAQIELIKVKFGNGNLDYDSFENFMSVMQTTIDERMSANDEAFVASVSSLKLRLDQGAITQKEYDSQLQTLIDGYNKTNATLKAEIRNVELQMIGEAYSKPLGEDAVDDLNNALQHAIDEGVDPITISDEKMAELLNIELEGNGETISNIRDMLSGVFNQLGLIPVEVDGELYYKIKENTGEEVENAIDEAIPDKVDKKVDVNIRGEKTIQNQIEILAEEFGIEDTEAASILWNLSGKKQVTAKIGYLASEFGINESEAATILWKLTGNKSIMNTISLGRSDFGIQDSYTFSPTVNLKAKLGTVTPIRFSSNGLATQEYRGGIVGGSSNLAGFARGGVADGSDGGIVRGGAQLIKVAEEGSPEMIIPLSSQRRDRALKLWAKAGEMLGVTEYARGGRSDGGADESIRSQYYGSNDRADSNVTTVSVNGVNVNIHVEAADTKNIVEAIKAQGEEIADAIAGIFADALGTQFENTPVRGGS